MKLNSFEYKGYKLVEEDDIEPGECRKIFHMVTPPEGKEFMMPMTPYENLSEENFQHWIDMGMPSSERGNLDNRTIEYLWRNKK